MGIRCSSAGDRTLCEATSCASGFSPPLGFPPAAFSRARNPCAQEGKPRVSAEPGGRSHRFATVRGVRRGWGQTRVFLHRFRFNCPAKQPCWPLGFGGLWVFSPAPQILAPRPQSVSRRAAENAKTAETPLRHLFPLTSHLFPPPHPSRFVRIVASTAPFAAGDPLRPRHHRKLLCWGARKSGQLPCAQKWTLCVQKWTVDGGAAG